MVSLLVAVQFALSFVSGVELVTVFFLCFCLAAGVSSGMITATAFSLVRCLLFGFYPNVALLYLIYYNAFALLFGSLGKRSVPAWVCPVLLGLLMSACLYFAIAGVSVSALYQRKITIMLWVLFSLFAALTVLYIVLSLLGKGKRGELACITALACFCTVCFTLLDDLLTPLVYGYSFEAATAYFYAGFTAMLPQTICTALSVFLLYYPLEGVFEKVVPKKSRRF